MTKTFWILDEDGRTPIPTDDILAWGQYMSDISLRRVGLDHKNPHIEISTIFYGLPRLFRGGELAHFETMVSFQDRPELVRLSATWEEAEAMHRAMCAAHGVPCKSIKA